MEDGQLHYQSFFVISYKIQKVETLPHIPLVNGYSVARLGQACCLFLAYYQQNIEKVNADHYRHKKYIQIVQLSTLLSFCKIPPIAKEQVNYATVGQCGRGRKGLLFMVKMRRTPFFDLEYRTMGQTCLPAIFQDFYPPLTTIQSACLAFDLTKISDKYGSISVLVCASVNRRQPSHPLASSTQFHPQTHKNEDYQQPTSSTNQALAVYPFPVPKQQLV